METPRDFTERHTAESVKNAFVEKGQNVEIVRCDPCSGDNGWYLVIDSPEYDFMWHRMSYKVSVNQTRPFTGRIDIEFYGEDNARIAKNVIWHQHHSFGDCLEQLRLVIHNRLADE